ncbi:MAG: rod shape-determining protein MreD [Thermoanaerobaculia bacterium]
MRLLKFVLGLGLAALLHFAGERLFPHFSQAVDLFLLVAALEARHGSPVSGMFAGLAAGLLADGLSGGPYGLAGFADTAVGFGIARAAQQLVVQRTTGLAAVFAAGAAAQQAILAALALAFRDHAELPDPLWLLVKVGTTAALGLAWTSSANAIASRLRFRRANRATKIQLPG